MKRKIKVGLIIIIALVLSMISFGLKELLDINTTKLLINSNNTMQLPKNFRMSNSKIKDAGKTIPNLKGFASLNISGSGQFSENGLIFIKQAIGDKTPIIIVDLKQESHGFINGTAVSWVNVKNNLNKGITKEQVLETENNKLQSITINKKISIDKQNLVPIKVQNEEKLVESMGMAYVRVPVTDKEKPIDATVDYFVQFVKTLPQNTWVHFHCEEGLGRTTTFMVMYDIMKNAKKVELNDIMSREILFGGQNLLEDKNNVSTNAKQRAEFIKKFYKYALQNDDNFNTIWSEWLKNN
nr:phosphatase [uncultured Clostridium sp.]